MATNGWSELGAMLGGNSQARQMQLQQQGMAMGMRQASMLEDARRKRDAAMGLAQITPQAIQNATSGLDPVTGQPFAPEVASQLQSELVSAMLHAGRDPRQISGYAKDQQGIDWGKQAMAAATGDHPDLNLVNRINMVRQGTPVDLTTIQGNTLIDRMVTPDQQAAQGGNTPTQIGIADMMQKTAQANERNAHARLFDRQTAAGGFRPDPNAAGVPTASPAGVPGGVPLPNNMHGDAFLGTLSPGDAATVKALAEGRLAFPTGAALKAPYWQTMLTNVATYDPSFEAANYQARSRTRNDFTSGKAAQTINSLNTVLGHMGDLSDAADKLNNSGLPWWNKLANATLSATGDPRIKEFEANKKAVVDEMTRVYRGTGGSEQDIKTWSEALDNAGSPQQLQGVIGKISELLQSKINALTDQYRQGMGTIGQHQSFITPKAQATLRKLEHRAGMTYASPGDESVPSLTDSVRAAAGISAAAPVSAAPAPATAPAAPVYRAVDPKTGHAVIWNGSAWVPE
ncbi:hypothetical protein ACO2Q2_13360 [Dyella sp. KRB-257]|uniref:hypothetical protein n=1 Tax=Dyella sp. KRB-257 TaxID=3400915 RepID=UPI003C124BD5